MPPAHRQRLAQVLRYVADLADLTPADPADTKKPGVLSQLPADT
jgi:hypothetical protein